MVRARNLTTGIHVERIAAVACGDEHVVATDARIVVNRGEIQADVEIVGGTSAGGLRDVKRTERVASIVFHLDATVNGQVGDIRAATAVTESQCRHSTK